MKRIIPVTKVAFCGCTGDNRSPESLAFPACMASLMEALGEDYGKITIHAHNREYTKRLANHQFLAASGMAFGLLWHHEFCMSALDLMQVTALEETIRRAFLWAGYEYELLEHVEDHMEMIRAKVVASIDRSVPILVWNLFDPPECAIVAGYDEDGKTLIGWSHFQGFANLPTEENGMFRISDWERNFWFAAIPGKKTERTLTYTDVLRHGLDVMRKEEIEGYAAGKKAYDAWIQTIKASDGVEDTTLKARYDYHHSILFSLAELRCWGADFLLDAGVQEAAACFQEIHELCWKADAVAKDSEALKSSDKREALIDVLCSIRELDARAMRFLAEAVS